MRDGFFTCSLIGGFSCCVWVFIAWWMFFRRARGCRELGRSYDVFYDVVLGVIFRYFYSILLGIRYVFFKVGGVILGVNIKR